MRTFHIILITQLIWLFFKDRPFISWGWVIALYMIDAIFNVILETIIRLTKEINK